MSSTFRRQSGASLDWIKAHHIDGQFYFTEDDYDDAISHIGGLESDLRATVARRDEYSVKYGEGYNAAINAVESLRWAVNSLDEQTMQEGCTKALKAIIEGFNL